MTAFPKNKVNEVLFLLINFHFVFKTQVLLMNFDQCLSSISDGNQEAKPFLHIWLYFTILFCLASPEVSRLGIAIIGIIEAYWGIAVLGVLEAMSNSMMHEVNMGGRAQHNGPGKTILVLRKSRPSSNGSSWCSATTCRNNKDQNRDLAFHRVPTDAER